MIVENKDIKPFIDFGFGIVSKTVIAGQPVQVWLSSLYSTEQYSMQLFAGAAMVKVISAFEYEATFSMPGTYEVSLSIFSRDKRKALTSNTITVTVI